MNLLDAPAAQLRAAVTAVLPEIRTDLERLVAIPSVSFAGYDHTHVEASAAATADVLRRSNLTDVRIVRAHGQPAVLGRREAPAGAPTVLLYAHHDVQPVGDLARWRTDPFVATEVDGRLYGRGVADDKAGIMVHAAALRAFGDALPVGVVVFVEGEEEYGSGSLERLLRQYRDELAADVIVIADSRNWDIGVPALTTSLRGTVNVFVEVRTLHCDVHSGMFGGPVPDALSALVQLLSTLHDGRGNVVIEGLTHGETAAVDYSEERLHTEAGIVDRVALIGSGSITDRLWAKPAVSILGIDAPPTSAAPNSLVASARAKVSVRFAPTDDCATVYKLVKAHLEAHVPWGAQLRVSLEHDGTPCVIDTSGPMYDAARAALREAWDGVDPVEIGVGGSIPFISTFRELYPEATVLVTGVEDPYAAAHSPNESLHLGEFARACLAETLLLRNVANCARQGVDGLR